MFLVPFGMKLGSGVTVSTYIVSSMIPVYIGNTLSGARAPLSGLGRPYEAHMGRPAIRVVRISLLCAYVLNLSLDMRLKTVRVFVIMWPAEALVSSVAPV